MKSTVYGKGAKGRATRLHSQLVRSRGACENCGLSDPSKLQCAHICSRRYAATRTDETNAFCLCATCHFRFGDWPNEWLDFVFSKIGELGYARLRQKALKGGKVDWDAEVERLKKLLEAANV